MQSTLEANDFDTSEKPEWEVVRREGFYQLNTPDGGRKAASARRALSIFPSGIAIEKVETQTLDAEPKTFVADP